MAKVVWRGVPRRRLGPGPRARNPDLLEGPTPPSLEQVERPDDVDAGVVHGIRDRTADIHLSRVVHQYLDPGVAYQRGCLRGTDVELVELSGRRDVLLAPRGKVVNNQDTVALSEQRVGHVGADETRTSGDAHCP